MMYKFTALAVLCTLAIVHCQDKFANNTAPCLPRVYSNLEDCCSMPKLLPIEAFKTCFASQRLAPLASRAKRDTAPDSGTVVKRRNYGPVGGPMCLIECVFENQTLINENKEVILQAIQDKFVAASVGDWKPLVKEVCSNCLNEFNKVNFASMETPPPGVKVCKPNSAMILSCIRRQLTLRCPTSELSTTEVCKAKLETLKTCDPFAIPAPRALLNGQLAAAAQIGARSFGKKSAKAAKTAKKGGKKN